MEQKLKRFASRTVKNLLDIRNLPNERTIKKLKKDIPMIGGSGWLSDTASVGQGYLAVCQLAATDPRVFTIFRRSRDYRGVVETVTKKQGQEYLDLVARSGLLKYAPLFKENDTVGSPIRYSYSIGKFSPTTLRYVKILMDLQNAFGDLTDFNIVEIGAGYGGLCKIISDVYRFKSYTIIDLPVVTALAEKYLTELGVKNVVFEPQDRKEYDLVISNYALTELDRASQDSYIKEFLDISKRGYIIYTHDGIPSPDTAYNKKEIIEILSKKHEVKICDQRPRIRRVDEPHFTIMWGGADIQT